MALVSGNFAAAEDAVQEALARAWELSERGHHLQSLPAFVAAVSRNLLRDRFRRLLAEHRAGARMIAPDREPLLAASEHRVDVERAVSELPRRQREVAVFYYLLDFDIAEIAGLLRIPEGTVKGALHRARRSLAAVLGANDEEQEVQDVRR
jgi:RNA polymerase sigma-70 factor (ECF subfamily)